MRNVSTALALSLALAAAMVVAGCGSDSGSGSGGKQGGAVTILDTAGGIDNLDPGYWYYQTDYSEIAQTTQRWLYGWKPEGTTPTPDLATGLPKVSDGGKTLTIKIKTGIKYSPPLQNRTVKTADIKYALERCFIPKISNGYSGVYYSDIAGVKDFQSGKANEISGITTPDDQTLVIKTTKPVGVLANANALALPCTVPIPKDYAAKFDKGKTSTYGEHQVFTGPYMIAGADKGTVPKSGYSPGKLLKLVRNPSWDKSTDYKPAYLNTITVQGGNTAEAASRKTLDGQSLMSGDYAAPPTPILKSALQRNKDQLQIDPSQGNRYISLDTKVKPLDDINVRKALAAVTDRDALRLTRGGETLGPLATHFIPPEMPGFEEAGGMAGPGYDFYKNPNGDVNLAMSYMKKAGYKTGKYTGPALLMVADNIAPAKQTAEAWQSQIAKIGIKVNLREVPHATMLSKFCQVTKANVALCPTLGWGKDFFDSQSLIDPVFNGKNIVPSGNVNSAQANDPKLNAQMDKATSITDNAARAKAYGDLDRALTGRVYYITWLWDNQIQFASKNVNGVKSKFNSDWDLTFSSVK
jgi:peptide/nickel transport system substrate-binding protein